MKPSRQKTDTHYIELVTELSRLLDTARRTSARAVNAVMTATYWELGRRIVEFEQGGAKRAAYGEEVLARLAGDLTARFGRGFSLRNLRSFRMFYQEWPIRQTLSAESGAASEANRQTVSAVSSPVTSQPHTPVFPLPWSHYVALLAVKNADARRFYEAEALRGGWSVRQLDRQIGSLFYERTALSTNKAAMLTKGAKPQPGDQISPDEEVKDPLVLEFLNLKDEYSEGELEEALLHHLEKFLLELGGDFAFIGR
jgi:predicted nuclease of restriction endonuclease-like (RecB) superfamily